MDLQKKLEILADAAKYDASCASSGTTKRDSSNAPSTGLGSSGGAGICHSYTPDGRCVSLLKILMTNACIYDCHYCINRRSSDSQRARFTVDEVVSLTLEFYKRNYIEGLFLSSGIIRDPDFTMERVVEVARKLREDHDFRGYIHLKTIPEASQEIIEQAGRYADRISINVELPNQEALDKLAPEKNIERTQQAMGGIRYKIEEDKDRRKTKSKQHAPPVPAKQLPQKLRPYSPAGQSTQMIIGADDSNDQAILQQSNRLYSSYQLRRVYYSAFSPIPDASPILPLKAPPLVREHRLYQADWLLRFYGYSVDEIVPHDAPDLDLEADPKLGWALRNRHAFPIDLNRASKEWLVRVPGLGTRTVGRLLNIRRYTGIRLVDLQKLRVSLKKVLPFIITSDHTPTRHGLDSDQLRARMITPAKPEQLELFVPPVTDRLAKISAVTGQL